MNRMYFLYLSIVILAFIFNIFLVTQSNQPKSEVGIGPIIQLVFAIPILIISCAIFYFTKNTSLATNSQGLYILLPFLIEIVIFAFTKELFSVFKADGFLIRSYIYAIILATIIVCFLNWVWVKVF
jgi:hypothetical protein